MTVYLDNSRIVQRRMAGKPAICCKMRADDLLELEEMAFIIGLDSKYLKVDEEGYYYLVSQSKKREAFLSGAARRPNRQMPVV